MSRTVALFGGSFNPPHMAHVVATEYALSLPDVDTVWWVPVYRHAFAHKRNAVSFEDRLEMCKIATRPFGEQTAVHDIERTLGGTNRTIDTLEHLRSLYPDTTFRLLVGTDIFEEAHLWKAFERLEKEAPFIVLGRAGYPSPPGYDVSPPLPDISSASIREKIAEGESAEEWLPPGVPSFIASRGLYLGDSTS